MTVDPRAGKPAEPRDLIDVPRVVSRYYTEHPDPEVVAQRVAFGTSGHRGSSLRNAFNEHHIAATSQAIVEYRRAQGTDGPLFMGRDTHALSEPAMITALEVFAANDVTTLIDSRDGYTPHPPPPRGAGRAARDPGLHPRPVTRPRRRRGRHAVAQPAGRRRLQVQPAQRR